MPKRYNWTILFLGEIQEHDPSGWGNLKNIIKKFLTENYRPDFSSERAPHIIKSVIV
jgi:hypothetical protein